MNTEKLMNAIGGISDQYIIKFAEVKPALKPNAMWMKSAAVAACLCLAVIGTVLFMKNIEPKNGRPSVYMPEESVTNATQTNSKPGDDISHGSKPDIDVSQGAETNAPQPGETIWAGYGDQIWKDYSEQSVKGSIILADELKAVMEKSENAADIFAVWVTDTTGASKEEIYNTFVKPLGVEEDYIDTGIIFVTEEQINSLVCPLELALVLRLGTIPYEEEVWIDEAYLETAGIEKIWVTVFINFDDKSVLAKYKEQLEALEGNKEEQQKLQRSIIDAEAAQMINAVLNDYGISREEAGIVISLPSFSAELKPELIARLLTDERVDGIVKVMNPYGFDQ